MILKCWRWNLIFWNYWGDNNKNKSEDNIAVFVLSGISVL